MLVSLQEAVLDPEHQRITDKWQDDHHDNQFNFWVPIEDHECGCAPLTQLTMEVQLDEENEELGEEAADAPDDELEEPGA